jgi:hypothetical protein
MRQLFRNPIHVIGGVGVLLMLTAATAQIILRRDAR